jgi:pSer/pThr/pTyr-binding forkhead associated (FHA) protein
MSSEQLAIMIMSGPDDGQLLYLSREHGDGEMGLDGVWSVVIGRKEECDISLPFDTQVSRQHAILRVTPDDIWLEDGGSLNGTYVGKKRIGSPAQIQRGQLFRLGRTWLRIQPETDMTAS